MKSRDGDLTLLMRIWFRLSQNNDLGEYSFKKVFEQDIDKKNIERIFKELKQDYEVFSSFDISSFSSADIINAMKRAMGPLEPKINDTQCFSNDFMNFAYKFFDIKENDELYVPFATDFSFATDPKIKYLCDGVVDDFGLKIGALRILKNIDIEFKAGNAVRNPLFRKPEHMIRKFDNVLAMLFTPSAQESEIQDGCSLLEHFSLFRTRRQNPFLLSFQHVLESFEKKAIVIIPSGFASRGSEQDFREYLIRKNIIEAIISLPYGFWRESGAAVKSQILLLNKQKTGENITFLRLDDKNLKEIRTDFTRYTNELLGEQNAQDQLFFKKINTDDIKKESYSLITDVYFTKNKIDDLKKSFGLKNFSKLGDIAKLVRSQALKTSKEGGNKNEYNEILITDIPSSGFITKASRKVATNVDIKRLENYKIEPFDILLNARGNIGVVGIIGEFVRDEIYIASQTMQIIRLNSDCDKKKKAIALLMFLRSKTGQLCLESISDGTLMMQIISSRLKDLEVPIFTPDEEQKLNENFLKEIELNEKLDEIKKQIDEIHEKFLNYNS